MIPSDMPQKYTIFSTIPLPLCLLTLLVVGFSYNSTDTLCVTAGLIKAFLSQFAYFPQFVLIYKNKSTVGWSMEGVWMDILGSGIACVQVITDYFAFGKGTGFFSELNYGKFSLN